MMVIRQYFRVLLQIFFVFWCSVFSLKVLAADTISQSLRLAAVYVSEPPFIYLSSPSQYEGIVPDLAQALSHELDAELEYVPTPRKGLEGAIISGVSDMAFLSPSWVQHADQLIFSEPLLIHKEYLFGLSPFVKSGDASDWVNGKTICVRQDYQYPALQPFFDNSSAQAVGVSSQVPLVNLLVNNRCDLVYMNGERLRWMAENLSIQQKIYQSPKALSETNMAFMFASHRKDEMPRINQALSKLINEGKLAAIIQKHLHGNGVSSIQPKFD